MSTRSMKHPRRAPRPVRRPAGFTLIEVLIVVVILGLLAGIVVPSLSNSARDSNRAAFVTNLRTYGQLFALQHQRAGAYPADRTPGVLPPEMAGLIGAADWARPTPLGGGWDWDRGVFGVAAGVSVYQPDATAADMTAVDRMIDDGNLNTGAFRRRSNGYILIIKE